MRGVTAFSVLMTELAQWYLTRLRVLPERPRAYGVTDTVNPPLMRRGLIVPTSRDLGRYRREYEITEAGRAVLREQTNATCNL